MKRFVIWLMMAVMVLSLSACGSSKEEEAVTIEIAALKGPTALGMLELMGDPQGVDTYNFTLAGSPDEVVGRIVQGEFDIAAIPTNLAATLYNRTEGGVQLAALNTLGVLYCVEIGDTVNSVEDLAGKTLYNLGKGSTPEFAINFLLEKNGLDPENDVEIIYATEASEVASLMASGEAKLALLPQPFVTSLMTQNENVRIAFSVTDEWNKVGDGSTLSMGSIIVQKSFIEEHPDAFARFMEAYEHSVAFVNDEGTLAQAAQYAEQFDIIKAAVAEKAVPQCNIVFIAGDEMKEVTEGFLQVLYDADPAAVGGALPADDFYYNAK